MTKTAWVFPGQGSQALGMGTDLLDIPTAKEKFAQAEAILGWSVSEICQNEEKLSQTLYTQPSLYVVESILADLTKERGHQPDLVAGHSLGEYIALYVAGVFEWSAGLKLVKRRAELMDSAAGGMMAAMMNFDREQLETVIAQTPDVVLANDNSPAQVVISGTPEAVQTVMSQVKAKRAVPLKVSGAFHSHLMNTAAVEFQEILETVEFQQANVPVLSNVEPVPAVDATILKQRLSQQMTGSVRWREISLTLPVNGIEKVVEIGPGNVLTGLIKRTTANLILKNIRNAAELLN
ncbi:Malonyl CoA-acyl carrier protein transacylase [Trichormus variabilis ATCC 29413]|uniref:Malonyl CoA-acyl carrier protein transacylase n=2 Tax=Anabaena variabilis TaxID=264691 RepID=Q3M9J3_TRIV2|nr:MULTISPECIES: ACP S-malonyltransferase [Nostocaceae]ABA22343.1 Malonyl CoA-acyl carrier protein transacylase [Trichormus variabilis ATCC 29413]MBC1213232.1 ACP S-malonyltransferase [Trichormus variabilis ARAD]MBC1256052.1 ACP S-malonyltransferase [Trichormus variabilis V5]MBC1268088.1 ACP S-malonyltransferase [Trichormus variabilis FSR]MBC1301775.1 ACP S-malonyltransferase [Trichormus variabilis N2B]